MSLKQHLNRGITEITQISMRTTKLNTNSYIKESKMIAIYRDIADKQLHPVYCNICQRFVSQNTKTSKRRIDL